MPASDRSRFRSITAGRIDEFRSRGFHRRHFFPHRAYTVPRAGPDGLQLARAMYGISAPARLKQVLICICHDVERALGHISRDPAFVPRAAEVSPANLGRMLEIEARRSVRGTYDVVGTFLNEVRSEIERSGHELAFHSYDHTASRNQLPRCRQVDYRIRGYRPPNSRVTPELTDEQLGWHNFEWLASSPDSLGTARPALGPGTVRVPIFFDDFPMYKHAMPFQEWSQQALQTVARQPFTAFGLHDCYAGHWLDGYDAFLGRLTDMGTLRTVGEVADRVLLGCAE